MSKRGISILAVLLVSILICAGVIYAIFVKSAPEIPPRAALSTHPELYTYYDEAVGAMKDITTSSTFAQPYLHVGMEWSTIGSITKDPVWYKAAERIYEQGDAALQGKNSIILINLADAQENLGNYTGAKSTLERAIALSPGDASVYSLLIALMRTKMNASTDDILAVYAEGIKRVYGQDPLYVERAAYYRDIGKYTEARADYDSAHAKGLLSDTAYASALAQLAAAQK